MTNNPEVSPAMTAEEKCRHEYEEHCVTEMNGAGVHREYWLQCAKCGAIVDENDHRADCEGCNRSDCPCNREVQ